MNCARSEKLEQLFCLALEMQDRSQGVSINFMKEEYGYERRTAYRMLEILKKLFLVEEVENPYATEKRWKITKRGIDSRSVNFTPEEIACLESCINQLQMINNAPGTGDMLKTIKKKMNVISKAKAADVEALLEAEGYARRQYPRRKVDDNLRDAIAKCLKAQTYFEFDYVDKVQKISHRKVQPYAIIYGENTLLLAYDETKKDFRNFIFHKISNYKVLDDEYFDKDESFNLEEYLNRSFGIYQDKELMDIELLFKEKVAKDVMEYNFHATQQLTKNDDGTVTLKMHTGGKWEICWHLFRWGENVKIIKPQILIDEYKKLLEDAFSTLK